jgi:tRNA threonylcarbamoyladenosine biosynthesis protein TsaB
MNILALDTATDILSAALMAGEKTYAFTADAGLKHSEILLEIIDILFKQAGIQAENLDGVACMKGPGSFTGLRIAYAAAKGLALALGIPLAAFPSLDCMAFPFPSGLILPVIDAKKHRYFAALYRGRDKLTPDLDAGAETIAENIPAVFQAHNEKTVVLTGPGADMIYEELENSLKNLYEGRFRPVLQLDPRRRGGWSTELLEIAKSGILHNNGSELLNGPEYIRGSTSSSGPGGGFRKSNADLHSMT